MRDESGKWIPEKGIWPLIEGLRLADMSLEDLDPCFDGDYNVHAWKEYPNQPTAPGPTIGGMVVRLKHSGKFVWNTYESTPEEIAASLKAA